MNMTGKGNWGEGVVVTARSDQRSPSVRVLQLHAMVIFILAPASVKIIEIPHRALQRVVGPCRTTASAVSGQARCIEASSARLILSNTFFVEMVKSDVIFVLLVKF